MDEIRKIPPVTRTLTLGTLAVSGASILHLVSPYLFLLSWPRITQRLELWRIVTPFLFGSSGISLLFDLFLLYRHTNELELSHFHARTADMTWAIGVMAALILALSNPLKMTVLFRPLLLAIVHLWSQAFQEQRVSLYGFVTIPARYFSFALLGLDVLTAGPGLAVMGLTGIIAAQAFWYLSEEYPRTNGGRRLPGLQTPRFLVHLLGNGPGQPAGGGEPARGGGYRVGGGTAFGATGQRLGRGTSSSTTTTQQPRASTSTNPMSGYKWGKGTKLGTE